MDADDIRRRVDAIRWFHSIDLGGGVVTPGSDRSTEKLARLRLPERLDGRSVLDVGAWNGFFSFEAERRGASRVLAVDSFCWSGQGWGTQDGFLLAREALRSQVEDREMEVLELGPELVGVFDVVLCLGVLYHMKHPLLALERVASVTRELLVIETHVDLLSSRRPAMALYPGAEHNDDPTNWCGPKHAALQRMLLDVGITTLERDYLTPRWKRAAREVKRHLRGQRPLLDACRQGRAVYHARK
jgi:tRNA (mo5U34)-methyltransferase